MLRADLEEPIFYHATVVMHEMIDDVCDISLDGSIQIWYGDMKR